MPRGLDCDHSGISDDVEGFRHTITPRQTVGVLPRCPETIEARTITHAVDLWALGVILYQMVTLEARCAARLVVPLRAFAFIALAAL